MTDPEVIEVVAMLGDSIVDIAYLGTGGYRIGTAPRVDLAVPELASFVLVNNLMFHRAPGLVGELIEAGVATPIDVAELAIPRHGHIRARLGLVTLAIRRIAAPRRELPRGLRVDRRALGYLLGSLALHAMLWGVAANAPPDEPDAPIASGPASRFDDTHLVAITGVHPVPELERDHSPDVRNHGAGAPMTGIAGKAGNPTADHRVGHIQVAKRTGDAKLAPMTRDEAMEAARDAGILGSTALRADQFATLAVTTDLSSGFDALDAHAPLYGGQGEAAGQFGLARDGGGHSAGCIDNGCWGTIGTGRYGTLSNGITPGKGWGGGNAGAEGVGRLRRHDPSVPQIYLCASRTCVVSGGLDKAIIRRYIRRHLQAFQYCYEKELLARPGLADAIMLDFLIAADGTVSSIATEGDPAIASCAADIVRGIAFPRSPSATEVRYPLGFRVAGD